MALRCRRRGSMRPSVAAVSRAAVMFAVSSCCRCCHRGRPAFDSCTGFAPLVQTVKLEQRRDEVRFELRPNGGISGQVEDARVSGLPDGLEVFLNCPAGNACHCGGSLMALHQTGVPTGTVVLGARVAMLRCKKCFRCRKARRPIKSLCGMSACALSAVPSCLASASCGPQLRGRRHPGAERRRAAFCTDANRSAGRV